MALDPRRTILSAALCSAITAREMCEALAPEDFPEGQRPIFQAIRDALSATGGVETTAVFEALDRLSIPNALSRMSDYLNDQDDQIRQLAYDSEGRQILTREIRNARLRRDLKEMIAEERIDEIPEYLAALSRGKQKADGPISDERIDEFLALIEANASKATLGIPTGISTLDEITGGMIPGTVWAVGAPTSAGKTTLLCQMVVEAIRNGAGCLFFSLEMSIPLMYARLAGAWCGLNPFSIFRGRLSDLQKANVEGALRIFSECGLQVFREITDAEEIARRSKEARLKKTVNIVAIDFMQNVTAKADSMLQRMAEGARILQGMAGELNACVLVASQLSNEAVKEKAGGIFSYRYASELSHAADVGIEMVSRSTGTDLHVRKNRHGKTGKVEIKFNDSFSAFIDRSPPADSPRPRNLWGQ